MAENGKHVVIVLSYLSAVVLATGIFIYSPLFLKSNRNTDAYDFVPGSTPVLVSYACVLAAAAAVIVDGCLDLCQILTSSGEFVDKRLQFRRVVYVVLLVWPSLHGVLYPEHGRANPMLCDAIMQKYVTMLIVIGIHHQNDKKTWNRPSLMFIISCLSLGIILSSIKSSVGHWSQLFIAQYVLEAVALASALSKCAMTYIKLREKRPLILLLAAFFITQMVLLALLQCSFGVSPRFFQGVLVASNYVLVAWSTLPTILPSRMDRENARYVSKLNEFRQSFLSYISHEIRTPLNVSTVGVAIMEEFLQSRNVLDGEIGDVMEQTKRALGISTEILNDLLTFEKLNSNLMTLEQTLQRPLEFVVATANLFEFQAREKKIELILPRTTTPVPDELLTSSHSESQQSHSHSRALENCFVFIDTYKMSQVIRNLVSNAIKFTPTGGHIRVKVEVVYSRDKPPVGANNKKNGNRLTSYRLRQQTLQTVHPIHNGNLTEWLRISVVDDGAGIAPENIGKLFKEIIQFEANKLQQGKGTGLGMYISRGIVELHGGRINAHSEGEGFGCTFSVDLPLIRLTNEVVQQSRELGAANNSMRSHHLHTHVAHRLNVGQIGNDEVAGQYDLNVGNSNSNNPNNGSPISNHNSNHNTGSNQSNNHSSHSNSNHINTNHHYHHGNKQQSPIGLQHPIREFSLEDIPEGTSMCPGPSDANSASRRAGPNLGGFGSEDPAERDDVIMSSVALISHTANQFMTFSGLASSQQQQRELRESGGNVSHSSSLTGTPRSRRTNASSMHRIHTRRFSTQSIVSDIESGRIYVPSPTDAINPSRATQFSTLDLRDYRVLLVDDSSMNLKMMTLMVRKFGGECVEASNGDAAFKLIKAAIANGGQQQIDIVIMDNNMDVMSGPQACKLMREAGYGGPIFGLTGDVDPKSDEEYLAAGADYIFRKPLKIQEIIDKLTKCVND